ncbi:MAG TPA: transposase [Bryobacteraceae bacterium]|nr:transposase [Bryobacteraceae bacterium]
MGEEIVSSARTCGSYLKVIRENCSEALHVLDRFHIVANMNKALDDVRAEEARRMQREGRSPILRKSRWLLLRRNENLRDETAPYYHSLGKLPEPELTHDFF